MYKNYEWNSNEFTSAHKSRVDILLKLLKGVEQPILDVGCGNGVFANYLIEKKYDIYGIDASASGIEQAKISNNGRFFVQNIEDKQVPEAIKHIPFKTIISTEVIEHLYDPRDYLSFLRETLKQNNGKYLIISTPYFGFWKNLLISIFNRWDVHHNPLWDGGHIKFWSRKTITDLLNEQGFLVERFEGIGRFKYLWTSMMIKAYLK